MDDITRLIVDLLIVLTAGLVAGAISKRLEVSLLVGYLLVGALIGDGTLGWVTQENRELEYLARGGALLMLFAVGIEFSLEELVRLRRFFLVGGAAQMLLVAIPLTMTCLASGMSTDASILAGSAGALSSTVLVFKSLAEWGETASRHGRRAIAILLFQDVALVPLMLLIPLLTTGRAPTAAGYSVLVAKSIAFVAATLLLRWLIRRWVVSNLTQLRSVELVILFALSLLGGACWGAYSLGLPPAIGALAAGIMLSGNRLSRQIDTIVLPFRETFAAVFFVTLGTLLHPGELLEEPLLLILGLVGMLALKSIAAAIALRLVGLTWPTAMGMGLGLAQLGEFSFLVVAEGVAHDLISAENYNRMLFVGIGTLILTPQLLKVGLRWTGDAADDHREEIDDLLDHEEAISHALVVGVGTIGRQVASRLEIMGADVCLVDLSPINLHAYAQQGFHTVAGDARDDGVLRRARAERCKLVVVALANDELTRRVVALLRELNPRAVILARCHYLASSDALVKAGATTVVSEEAQTANALLRECENHLSSDDGGE